MHMFLTMGQNFKDFNFLKCLPNLSKVAFYWFNFLVCLGFFVVVVWLGLFCLFGLVFYFFKAVKQTKE